MTYIDVSVDVWERLPVWPGTPRVEFQRNFALEAGDEVNDTTLRFSVHTGTHIDAPLHFLRGGKSVDQIPLEVLISPLMC